MALRTYFLLSLLLAAVFSVVPPMPAFMWTGNSGIMGAVNHEAAASVSTSNLVEIIKRVSGNEQEMRSELSSFFANSELPELVVVFVHPELHTSQVTALSAAFDKNSNGGAFKNLKAWLQSAAGSLTLPYVYQVGDLSLVEELKQVSNVHLVHAEDAPAFLHSHSRILHDGKPDVVVLTFSSSSEATDLMTKLGRDDAIMKQVIDKVNAGSHGKFLAMLTANAPTHTTHKSTTFAKELLMVDLSNKAYLKDSSSYTNYNTSSPLYMTPALLSSLSISLLLILITACGVGGLMGLKTPDLFEGEGGYLAGN